MRHLRPPTDVPTYERANRFLRDYRALTPDQRKRFQRVVIESFVPDLVARGFRPGLRVKRVQGALTDAGATIYEMTWAPDGRATWSYGTEVVPGEPHIIWRRVGTHDIFDPGPPRRLNLRG